MIRYEKYQSKSTLEGAAGKWFIRIKADETLDLKAMAEHMADHDCGYSEAMIFGVLKALVKCTKEQLLAGKKVKLDDLAIFYLSCHCKGADSAEEATPDNIKSISMRALATGRLSSQNVKGSIRLKEQDKYTV